MIETKATLSSTAYVEEHFRLSKAVVAVSTSKKCCAYLRFGGWDRAEAFP